MTQFFILPVQNAPSMVVIRTIGGWLQCQARNDGEGILVEPVPFSGQSPFCPDAVAYPIPVEMMTRASTGGQFYLDPYFYETDWANLEYDETEDEGEDEGEWEDIESPEYEEACQGLPLYEDVPPPPYEVAILSPPAY